jgi:hypothetical protein
MNFTGSPCRDAVPVYYCMPIFCKMGTFPDFFMMGSGFIKIYNIRISRLKKDPEQLSLKQRVTFKKQ